MTLEELRDELLDARNYGRLTHDFILEKLRAAEQRGIERAIAAKSTLMAGLSVAAYEMFDAGVDAKTNAIRALAQGGEK